MHNGYIFYCENCKNALVDIENECWTCGQPLDSGRKLAEDEPVPSATTTALDENPEIQPGTIEKKTKKGSLKGTIAGEEGIKAPKKGSSSLD